MRMGAIAVVVLLSACSGAAAQPAHKPLDTNRPMVVSVLGDSTGNDPGEWVDLWARHLGARHVVVEHTWSWKYGRWNATPIRYGSTGSPVTIWNGSMPGAQPKYALDRLATMRPARFDLLVLSYGHNGFPQDTTAGLSQLTAGVTAPRYVVLQNPGLDDHAAAQDRNLAAVKAWAAQTHTPTIDVTSAFRQRGPRSLMRDHAHPNPAGSALWESVVQGVLG